MDLKYASASLAAPVLQDAVAQQRASSTVNQDGAGSFSGAMKSALGTISESIQEAKSVWDASALPGQQRADLAAVFQGFGVLMDQLAQTYAPHSAGAGAAAPAAGALTATTARALALVQGGGATNQGDLGADSTSTAAYLANRSALPTASSLTAAPTTGTEPAAWQSYFSSTAYQGAQSEYLAGMQKGNPTDQWVIAALNRAIGQNVANGYDPEKSHAVNTLRGYFSGDAQAKSAAIHSIDSSFLKAGNAYETYDYGLHTIAGAAPEGMNTTMPAFKSDYDKDWNRPSLYDQINSSLGWTAASNQYSDPASRDAALNRKLSDSEIMAFQSGSLTPELQALVNKYRGG